MKSKNQILVAYASKYGSTQEIAKVIAEVFKKLGQNVTLDDVSNISSVKEFDVVIIGSAVYVGQWMDSAKHFVKNYRLDLIKKSVWIFSSGPIGNPLRPESKKAVLINEIEKLINPKQHKLFAGSMEKNKINIGEKAMMKLFGAPYGDFRDWDQIRTWAVNIVQQTVNKNKD